MAVMIRTLTGVILLAAAVVATGPARAALIGGLDGVSIASTFETGSIVNLPNAGWVTVSGTARMWDNVLSGRGNNGTMTSHTKFDNFGVQYDTTAQFAPNTVYTLSLDMGFIATVAGGSADYSFSLGTIQAGIFTGLATKTGTVAYAGNIFDHVVSATEALAFATGNFVPSGTIAVRWFQTANNGPQILYQYGSSDSFAFDNVLLDATAVPLPPAAWLFLTGLGMAGALGWRRRRAM